MLCSAPFFNGHATGSESAVMVAYDLQEVDLLRSVSFDGNIVQFYGACLQPGSIMMVLELMGVSVKSQTPGSAHLAARWAARCAARCAVRCAADATHGRSVQA